MTCDGNGVNRTELLRKGFQDGNCSTAREVPAPPPPRPTTCAPHGVHCARCNGVHGVTADGFRTFVTSLTWPTHDDDDEA